MYDAGAYLDLWKSNTKVEIAKGAGLHKDTYGMLISLHVTDAASRKSKNILYFFIPRVYMQSGLQGIFWLTFLTDRQQDLLSACLS